jgi:hypothetical protein
MMLNSIMLLSIDVVLIPVVLDLYTPIEDPPYLVFLLANTVYSMHAATVPLYIVLDVVIRRILVHKHQQCSYSSPSAGNSSIHPAISSSSPQPAKLSQTL